MVDTRVTDIPFMLAFLVNLKRGGGSYWIHGYTNFRGNIYYKNKIYYDPTIQYFILGKSSGLNS